LLSAHGAASSSPLSIPFLFKLLDADLSSDPDRAVLAADLSSDPAALARPPVASDAARAMLAVGPVAAASFKPVSPKKTPDVSCPLLAKAADFYVSLTEETDGSSNFLLDFNLGRSRSYSLKHGVDFGFLSSCYGGLVFLVSRSV